MDNYYSATSYLAWCINHYCYGGMHYTWAAAEFYPYRLPNPKSSNPLLSYQDLYHPWKDRDPYDRFLTQHRMSLKNGVTAKEGVKAISTRPARRLRRIIDKVDILYFMPVVYRIDISPIAVHRLQAAGSGVVGSHEYLIDDISESEFELLFLDFSGDADFDTLKVGAVGDAKFALKVLEAHCR
jgi:hypothetical protein